MTSPLRWPIVRHVRFVLEYLRDWYFIRVVKRQEGRIWDYYHAEGKKYMKDIWRGDA